MLLSALKKRICELSITIQGVQEVLCSVMSLGTRASGEVPRLRHVASVSGSEVSVALQYLIVQCLPSEGKRAQGKATFVLKMSSLHCLNHSYFISALTRPSHMVMKPPMPQPCALPIFGGGCWAPKKEEGSRGLGTLVVCHQTPHWCSHSCSCLCMIL